MQQKPEGAAMLQPCEGAHYSRRPGLRGDCDLAVMCRRHALDLAAVQGNLTGAECRRQEAHHQGKRPVSSWYSIMPRLHMSASRPYSRLNTSAEGRELNQVHQ